MTLFSIFGILLSLTCFILACIVLAFGKLRIHRIWALLNIATVIWGLGLFFVGMRSASQADALFWWKFAHIGGMLIPVFFLHKMMELCNAYKKKILLFFYAQAVFFIWLMFIDRIGWKLQYIFNSFFYVKPVGACTPYLFATFFWFGAMFYGFFILVNNYLKSSGVKKNQYKYLLLALIIGFAGGASHFLPVFGIEIYPFPILIVLYTIIATYAILKHRLLNVKVAFTRGAILLIVYVFIVGIPLTLVMIGKPLLVQYFQAKWFVPPLGLYTILALLGPYIYLRFQNKAEEKRMKQQVRLHQSLKAASKTTIEVQSIDKLSRIIPRYLLKLYHKLDNQITHISMFLHDKDDKVYHMQSSAGERKIPVDTLIREDSMLVKWFTIIRDKLVDEGVMRANDVEVLVYEDIDYWLNNPNVLKKPFKGLDKVLNELKKIMLLFNANLILPSVYQKELLGFLMLGEKTPDPYSMSDISTFSILANDSAMAFKAAQLFEDLKIAQARLIQSEKLNLLGQLASSMAHEINNPLAIISGNVQLLLMDEKDDSKRKFLQKISDQTERGYKIIHRLLNFSRLPKEEIKVIKVHEMIDETIELIGHKIKHGNIELIKEYNEVPDINGNPTQIQEVLLNLFVNGIQSMEEGGTLKISTNVVKHNLEILISDTGKGIEEKEVQNIFDPFYTKGKENGTGLGLFVASQVMGLHKGTINVESKVGQGTTFVLQFSIEKN
ncbi:MAG: ATP-binding protein [Candidatus Omnitrophota bacterium]